MTSALVLVTGCPVCALPLPYRAELEELLATGMTYARVALQLADRQPPVPAREDLAAHAAEGHMLPADERRQLARPAISGVPRPRA